MAMLLPLLLLFLLLYISWIAMMAVHECGHILHACISGGKIVHLTVPPFGFSRTDVSPNPSPRFVTWGGPVWGSVLPLSLVALLCRARRSIYNAARFFAGFCCVANGVYLGLGWLLPDGDAADLLRHHTSVWALILFGVIASATGLLLWHSMGRAFGLSCLRK